MMAIMATVQKWRAYLLGRHLIIKTNHQSLKYLMVPRVSAPMQQKWIAKLLGYDYELHYKKGAKNVVADALSRMPHASVACSAISHLQDLAFANKSNYSWKDQKLQTKGKLVDGENTALRSVCRDVIEATVVVVVDTVTVVNGGGIGSDDVGRIRRQSLRRSGNSRG
ncbi:hypothetical protein ACH5RR_003554 [Cinchona calisaya]|uniref:Reverse transcriptase RNase H-like domain-containing protein n=1 Tax=Cinchona calisaya TaxID=153742 RepID=A0ABD3AVB5_9GENT